MAKSPEKTYSTANIGGSGGPGMKLPVPDDAGQTRRPPNMNPGGRQKTQRQGPKQDAGSRSRTVRGSTRKRS